MSAEGGLGGRGLGLQLAEGDALLDGQVAEGVGPAAELRGVVVFLAKGGGRRRSRRRVPGGVVLLPTQRSPERAFT